MAKGTEILSRDEDAGCIYEKVAKAWDFIAGYPVPRFDVICETCGSSDVQGRDYLFSRKRRREARPVTRCSCRCDTTFKCLQCSKVIGPFGIPVTNEHFERMAFGQDAYYHRWRDAQEVIKKEIASHS